MLDIFKENVEKAVIKNLIIYFYATPISLL